MTPNGTTRDRRWHVLGPVVVIAVLTIGMVVGMPSGATAASSCSLSGSTLNVTADDGDPVKIKRLSGVFTVTASNIVDPTCGGASMVNVDLVSITGTGAQNVTIDLSGGQFEPGLTPESGTGSVSEIEFTAVLGDGSDVMKIVGSADADVLGVGATGINLNNDNDSDLTVSGQNTLAVQTGAGNDAVRADGVGPAALGGPYPTRVSVNGGGGNDTLRGGNGPDILTGSDGADVIAAAAGADRVVAGTGNDTVSSNDGAADDSLDCGADTDTVTALDLGDILTGCEITPTPPKPVITGTVPPSPANDRTPVVTGTTASGTSIRLYASTNCTGPVIGTGSRAAFLAGIQVTVGSGSTTQITAKATNSLQLSSCSDPIIYAEVSQRAEIEPNNGIADADANATNGVVFDENELVITGSLTAAGTDVFRVNVAAPTVVRLEVFNGGLDRCQSSMTLQMKLSSPIAGSTQYVDQTSGIGDCPAIVAHLAAGVYYVELQNATIFSTIDYLLEGSFLDGAGAEVEPNETNATATSVNGRDVWASGSHPTAGDLDVYRVTVAAGDSLRLEVIEGDIESCNSSSGVNSRLTVFNGAGTQIASDDDDGRGFCSRLDGTGNTPLDAGLTNLAAGTYYVQVRSSPAATALGAVFNYRLAVTVR